MGRRVEKPESMLAACFFRNSGTPGRILSREMASTYQSKQLGKWISSESRSEIPLEDVKVSEGVKVQLGQGR